MTTINDAMRAPGGPGSDLLSAPSGVRSGRNPKEVATQFEALLLRNMVESMRKTTTQEDEQSGGQLVEHLIDDALAGHLAKSGGIGLASLVDDQVTEPQIVTSTDMRLHLDRWVRESLEPVRVTEPTPLSTPETADPGQ